MIKKKLISSQRFTPSTVGNVVFADSNNKIYQVNEGVITDFDSSVYKENIKYFFDRLTNYIPNLIGNLKPKRVNGLHENAKWLSGIAAGAWYEFTLSNNLGDNEYRFRRISPTGNIDIDAVFVSNNTFSINRDYEILHNSNCFYCTIKQDDKILQLGYLRDFN